MASLDEIYSGGTRDSKPSLEDLYAGQKEPELGLLDVPGQAYSNLGPSAQRFGESLVAPVVHPVETAKGFYHLGRGVLENLGITNPAGYGRYADAAWEGIKERYGGYENLKKTAATDPVGFVGDFATLIMGGEALPGRIGEVARLANPVRLAEKGAGKLGEAAATVGGVVTGRSAETISGAAKAGYEGQGDFLSHLRDPDINAPELVTKARKALEEVRMERSAAYQNGMLGVKADNRPLDFSKINDAVDKARRIKQFEGIDISQLAGSNTKLPAEATRERIEAAVSHWQTHPDQFKTAAGLDALKQYIGDIRDSHAYGTPERKVAEEVYGAVRQTIVDQRPEYAQVMKDYQQASDMLSEIEKTLSLKKGTTGDTALRKLLSSTRSNVNSNFGRRLELAEELNKRDPSILPSLHGQSLAPWVPGGLRGAGAGIGTAGELGSVLTHGLSGLSPTVLAAMASASPRLWGELAYKAGQMGRKVSELTPQQVQSLLSKINPDIVRAAALGSRGAGVIGASQ